jgi:hypothetical protein
MTGNPTAQELYLKNSPIELLLLNWPALLKK